MFLTIPAKSKIRISISRVSGKGPSVKYFGIFLTKFKSCSEAFDLKSKVTTAVISSMTEIAHIWTTYRSVRTSSVFDVASSFFEHFISGDKNIDARVMPKTPVTI